jgi:hypothetical protein
MSRFMAVLIGVACLIGCSGGPPVQEMSDARQAIAAARTAGVASGSPELDAANAAITRAEDHLQAGDYTRARCPGGHASPGRFGRANSKLKS